MKKILAITSIAVMVLITVFVFNNEDFSMFADTQKLDKIEKVDNRFIEEKVGETTVSKTDLIETDNLFSAYDQEKDLFYISNKSAIVAHSLKTDLYMNDHELGEVNTLLAVKGNEHKVYQFVETGLPILTMESIREEQNDTDTLALVKAYDMKNKVSEQMLDYGTRGGSSIIFEKKSYNLKPIKDLPIEILGLPANNKYVLDSMYEDEYRMRDVLSWDICSQFQGEMEDQSFHNCTDMIYVELFIDDEYQGLYGLQDYNNEYKLGFDRKDGTIYETTDWDFPGDKTAEPGKKKWDSVELKYNDLEYSKRWDAMIELVDIMNIEEPSEFTKKANEFFDLDQYMNHYLMLEVIMARDNQWKNTFYSKATDEPMTISPWDLDMTFASKFTGKEPFLYITDYELNESILDFRVDPKYPLQKLFNEHESFAVDTANRYFELRDSILSKENLTKTIDQYNDLIRDSGAFSRDDERWPNGPKITEGKEEFISEFMDKRMEFLDDYFGTILLGEKQ